MKVTHKSSSTAWSVQEIGDGAIKKGSVVFSLHNGSTAGPFLVCNERQHSPREVSGCPNGQVCYFLVGLVDGYRYNLGDFFADASFITPTSAELVIEQ